MAFDQIENIKNKSKVYFCSARQNKLTAEETLPMKLDLILDKLMIRDRVKNESVAIKMHLGGNVGYSTIHPVFVRKVVNAVIEGGGKPFITDLSSSCSTAFQRGYTRETLGCPIYPTAGPDDKYFYTFEKKYKNFTEWYMGGVLHDATFLIDFSHVKGHPSCGFGAAIKNIALGGFIGKTRGMMHHSMHFDQYWFPEKCKDVEKVKQIVDSCPIGGISQDKNDPNKIYLHFENCNQCRRCLAVAPEGSLKIDKVNFSTFQEACAISASLVLSTFDKKKVTFINIANQITPVCDCFGFTGSNVMSDAGIFGSDDIISVEKATLDVLSDYKIMKENLPAVMEFQEEAGHPFQQIHGPLKNPYLAVNYGAELGLGALDYELIDLMPFEEIKFGQRIIQHISSGN
jgi:uncharacterized protein